VTYSGSKGISDIFIKIKAIIIKIKDLNITIEEVVLLTLINNLRLNWNQYRIIFQNRASLTNLKYEDIIKSLKNQEQIIKKDSLANNVKIAKKGKDGFNKGSKAKDHKGSCSYYSKDDYKENNCKFKDYNYRRCRKKGYFEKVYKSKPEKNESNIESDKKGIKTETINCSVRIINIKPVYKAF